MQEIEIDTPAIPRFLRSNGGKDVISIENIPESALIKMADEFKRKLLELHRQRKSVSK